MIYAPFARMIYRANARMIYTSLRSMYDIRTCPSGRTLLLTAFVIISASDIWRSHISYPQGISSATTDIINPRSGFISLKNPPFGRQMAGFSWRREWDSNPRAREGKRFSRSLNDWLMKVTSCLFRHFRITRKPAL